jgi:hypothetical protein
VHRQPEVFLPARNYRISTGRSEQMIGTDPGNLDSSAAMTDWSQPGGAAHYGRHS